MLENFIINKIKQKVCRFYKLINTYIREVSRSTFFNSIKNFKNYITFLHSHHRMTTLNCQVSQLLLNYYSLSFPTKI